MAHSGKTMTFATDLVPQEDNIYRLGYDNQRWKIYGDLQPLATKIYDAPLYNSSSGTNFYQNFAIVIPVDYNALWIAHYRITITAEGHSDYTEICDVSISGRANTYYSYKIYNSIVTYSIYQHMLLNSNSASNNQHELGYRMASSYGATDVSKVVKVELLEQINCTITLLDNLKLYTSATPSGYTWRAFNATSNGLQETGDSNDFGYYIQSNGFKGKAGSNKVYRYCLFARTGDGTYESFVMQDNTIATTKTVNPHGFVPDGKIYWNANNAVYSEGTLNISPYQQYHVIDYRYSFNFNNTFLPDYCETYVVYTYNEDDGLLYLDTAQWLAAALPTTADGKIYQRIGSKYYTGTSNYYQGSLLLDNPYYEYRDGDIRSWSATHLSNITGADDLKAIEAISGTTGLLKKTAANTWTLDTNTYSPTSHNHNSAYLKLDGSNNMTADVNIIAGDTDKFVNFWYNTNKTAGASWRMGMLGSGSGNTNYFVIQSGTSTTSATAWNNVLKIGQNNYDIYNNENRIPNTGNASGSVGGTTTPVYVDGGVIKTLSYTIAKSVPSDAKFTDTTYSAASNGGLSLSGTAFSITSGGVTNTMLAGSIANGKLANSKVTIAGNDVSLGGSLAASTLTESLGLSKALRFIGVTTTDMTGGTATNHSWTGTPAGISNYTPKQGDVVINSTKQDEWVCTSVSGTTYTWERLGSDTSYKIVQSAVTDPTASTTTSTTFIDTISQDANGVITATKKTLPTASSTVAGITKVGASGGAATYSHTHTISLTQTGTSTVNLAANTVYTLTAGGSSVVFKTPADGNIDTKVTQAYSTNNAIYPILMTATAGNTSTSSRGDTTAILNNSIYANPSAGQLNATTYKVNEAVILQYNPNDSSLEFVF